MTATMALLSSGKAQIFNDAFIDFVDYLRVGKWNANKEIADEAAFYIDKIITTVPINYKKDPNINYIDIFEDISEDENNQ